jgi:serine/threonine-protein kinase
MVPESLRSALERTYLIERELGAGGMATVYLARDLRHDRLVALKVLRPELAAVVGADRFLAEVRTTANLQHPHILGLIDSGQAEGTVFYVMPYVTGESLRDRLTREKQLPVDDALRITTEVAHALDYAHRQGVIHRDVKPENILLQDGQAMVADFGIALAATQAVGGRMTETGISLGTPQYMSPEQALGERDLTPRSDQYALACVLYELLAGEPPFTGPTVQAIVARVMTAEPDVIASRRTATPPAVTAALTRALQKVPADRFKSCGEFAEALRATHASHDGPLAGATSAPRHRALIPSFGKVAAGAGLLALGALGSPLLRGKSDPGNVVRFEISLPADLRLAPIANGRFFDISPDGQTLVFAAVAGDSQAGSVRPMGLYTRALGTLEPRVLVTGEARFPSFSRNGQALAYFAGTSLMRIGMDGGTATRLGDVKQFVRGISWGATGVVVGATTGGLLFFPNDGGEPRAITSATRDSLVWHMHPLVLPDEQHIVFAVRRGTDFQLAITSLSDSTVTVLEAGAFPLATLGNMVLFASEDGVILAGELDAKRRTMGRPVSTGIAVDVDPDRNAAAAYSAAGTLVYTVGGQLAVPYVVAASGTERRVPVEPQAFNTARFSPDGTQIAFDVMGPTGAVVWVLNRRSGAMGRLTVEERGGVFPEWSKDGRRLLYNHIPTSEVWSRVADGSEAASLVRRAPFDFVESSLSPDGKWLAYRTAATVRRMRDVVALPVDSTGPGEMQIEVGPFNEYGPRFSPNGKWIAYSSNESGRQEVYVRPFPGPGPRDQITGAGGAWPIWGGSERTLYFKRRDEVFRVGIRAADRVVVTSPPALVAGRVFGSTSHTPYDVSKDESEIVILRPLGDAPFTVALNWSTEFLRSPSRSR